MAQKIAEKCKKKEIKRQQEEFNEMKLKSM